MSALSGANVIVGGSAPISGLVSALGQASSVMINTMHANCIALPSVSIVKGKDTTVIIGADDRCVLTLVLMLMLILLLSIPIPILILIPCHTYLESFKPSLITSILHLLPPSLPPSVVDAAVAKGILYGAYDNVLSTVGVSAMWSGVIGSPGAATMVPTVVVDGHGATHMDPENLACPATNIVFFEAGAASKKLSEEEAVQR